MTDKHAPTGVAGKWRRRVTFRFVAPPASVVYLAGSFNGWAPTACRLAYAAVERAFVTELQLRPGLHEYKFIVDGYWCVDPACPDWTANDHGSLNSVIHVA